MKRWHAGWLWLCSWLCSWCSPSSLAAGHVPAAGPPAVDLAIEWVRYSRPPVPQRSGEAPADLSPAPAAGDPQDPGQTWRLRTEDRRLSMALQRWCVLAGWQLVWEAERDFPIEAGIEVQGTLASALEQVMKSLEDSDYPLQAVMNAQTRVLRMRRQLEILR